MQAQAFIPIPVDSYEQLMADFEARMRRVLQAHGTTAPAITQPNKEPRTVRQIAGKFNVCVATVWDWVRTGKIPSHKIGGRTYFFDEEVIDALEKNQRTLKNKKAQ